MHLRSGLFGLRLLPFDQPLLFLLFPVCRSFDNVFERGLGLWSVHRVPRHGEAISSVNDVGAKAISILHGGDKTLVLETAGAHCVKATDMLGRRSKHIVVGRQLEVIRQCAFV